MSEVMGEQDVRDVELEHRLSRLGSEIHALNGASEQIEECLGRLGVPHVPNENAKDAKSGDSDSYLGRLDIALEKLSRVRSDVEDHAARFSNAV